MHTLSAYPQPSVTVDCVIFGYDGKQLSVLLLNRKEEPYAGMWTIPGGFLYLDETLEASADRILTTKTGIASLFLEQLFTFGKPDRDPRGRVLSVAYYALINPERFELSAGNMANDVNWFPIGQLPELGFDHNDVLKTAIQRLQAKATYQPIGFELLNPQFTISELQDLYECILDVKLDRRNFHKKMMASGIVRPTGQKRLGEKNRAPELFEFDREQYNELVKSGFQFKI
ncbi:NUDIX hydrolase [Arsenicibacter rosenii]|uniref:NUDIX hydrolase n=1 Tax=Arsenicibacter rosenii TaxID=1750698 RepID=A0A1S2VQG9_9BACT|nr:NUDIX domain-containing protein [Arsenicibacter rosenii]OIN60048.1 NUDIX hydrolase [Arsenicibacter rosenii]